MYNNSSSCYMYYTTVLLSNCTLYSLVDISSYVPSILFLLTRLTFLAAEMKDAYSICVASVIIRTVEHAGVRRIHFSILFFYVLSICLF